MRAIPRPPFGSGITSTRDAVAEAAHHLAVLQHLPAERASAFAAQLLDEGFDPPLCRRLQRVPDDAREGDHFWDVSGREAEGRERWDLHVSHGC